MQENPALVSFMRGMAPTLRVLELSDFAHTYELGDEVSLMLPHAV